MQRSKPRRQETRITFTGRCRFCRGRLAQSFDDQCVGLCRGRRACFPGKGWVKVAGTAPGAHGRDAVFGSDERFQTAR
jgi:hypothetical protein